LSVMLKLILLLPFFAFVMAAFSFLLENVIGTNRSE
jgi:hypothetical protein